MSGEAIRWLPRYIWTNAHTSLIFWPPLGLILAARRWQQDTLPNAWVPDVLIDGVWLLLIATLALYLHTRTLLAPFLALHTDLPATVAALEGWRLGGQHFLICFATLVLGTLPVGVPLGLVALGAVHNMSEPPQSAMLAAAPDLIWAGIQAVRPVLIPGLYLLYRELWRAELTRRQQQGPARVPRMARVVLSVTQPLPKLGRWD